LFIFMRRLGNIVLRRNDLSEIFDDRFGRRMEALEALKRVPDSAPSAVLINVERQKHAGGVRLRRVFRLVIQDKIEIHQLSEDLDPSRQATGVCNQLAGSAENRTVVELVKEKEVLAVHGRG